MKRWTVRVLSAGVGLSLVLQSFGGLGASTRQDRVPLAEIVEKPYLDVLALSEAQAFRASDIEAFRAELRKEKEQKLASLKQEIATLKSQIDEARRKLQELNRRGSRDDPQTAKERREIHCQIQRCLLYTSPSPRDS